MAGRWLVEFSDHGIGGNEIEPLHLDALSAADLKEQLGMLAIRHGWIDFWVELNGLDGRLRFDGLEPGTDTFAEFTLRLDQDDEPVEMPWSVHQTVDELLLTIQGRLDCTVDCVTTIRGTSGGRPAPHCALLLARGEQEFQILHITPNRAGDGAEFTISDEEAFEAYLAFQRKHQARSTLEIPRDTPSQSVTNIN